MSYYRTSNYNFTVNYFYGIFSSTFDKHDSYFISASYVETSDVQYLNSNIFSFFRTDIWYYSDILSIYVYIVSSPYSFDCISIDGVDVKVLDSYVVS